MDLSEKIRYAFDNNLYLIIKDNEIFAVDAVDAKKYTDSLIRCYYLPQQRILISAEKLDLEPELIGQEKVLVTDNTFSNELPLALNKRIQYLAAAFPVKRGRAKGDKVKAVKIPKVPITSIDEILIKLLKEIEGNPDKVIDVSKFNRETYKGFKIVDKPRGTLRTRTMYDGYPFITSEDMKTLTTQDQFDQTNMGTAITIYKRLYNL